MKLTEEQKTRLEKAESVNELKEILGEVGVKLSDEDLKQISAGKDVKVVWQDFKKWLMEVNDTPTPGVEAIKEMIKTKKIRFRKELQS